jgi:hypothetical protein
MGDFIDFLKRNKIVFAISTIIVLLVWFIIYPKYISPEHFTIETFHNIPIMLSCKPFGTTQKYYIGVATRNTCSNIPKNELKECTSNVAVLQTDKIMSSVFLINKVDDKYYLSYKIDGSILSKEVNDLFNKNILCFSHQSGDNNKMFKFEESINGRMIKFNDKYLGLCGTINHIVCKQGSKSLFRLCLVDTREKALLFDIEIVK